MSNWYESTPKVRKMISIFLERCKKPIVCTAGNFFTLSLATLITVSIKIYWIPKINNLFSDYQIFLLLLCSSEKYLYEECRDAIIFLLYEKY